LGVNAKGGDIIMKSNEVKLQDCGITILFDHEGLRIELVDNTSSTTFAVATLSQEQTCQVLSRLCNTPCEIKVYNLDRVGKKMEHKYLEFPMPKHDYSNRHSKAIEGAKKYCPKDWEPDFYFGSQNSFYFKDGKEYARTTIRRWV
jgi:hypothetical protein